MANAGNNRSLVMAARALTLSASEGQIYVKDPRGLHEAVEDLSPGKRVKFMVEFGRKALTDDTYKDILSQLQKGTKYSQLLALHTAHGTRDVSFPLKLVGSRTDILRTTASSLVVLLASDDQLSDTALSLPSKVQPQFIKRLVKRKRAGKGGSSQVIDRVLRTFEANNEQALLRRYLPLASHDTITQILPTIAEQLVQDDWLAVIKRHPVPAYHSIMAWIRRLKDWPWPLTVIVDHLIEQLARSKTTLEMALQLFKDTVQEMNPSSDSIHLLMARRPEETAQTMLKIPRHVLIDISKHFKKMPTDLVFQVIDQQALQFTGRTLNRMTQEQKALAYERYREQWKISNGAIDFPLVQRLPSKQRVFEARRNFAIARETVNERKQIEYAALLPWDEAMALQDEFLKSSITQLRDHALQYQIFSVKYQRDRIGDALSLVLSHQNVADPTREIMCRSLRGLPASTWKEVSPDVLDRVALFIKEALDKTDTTPYTIGILGDMTVHIGIYNPVWAASQLAIILKQRLIFPSRSFLSLGHLPIEKAMQYLIDGIHPVVQEWFDKDEVDLIINLAEGLGPHRRRYPQLLDMLESILKKERMVRIANNIVRMLLKVRPARTRRLILSQLEMDNSWVLLSKVQDLISKEAHLLSKGSFLERRILDGQFVTRREMFFSIDNFFGNMTQDQQTKYAKSVVMDIKESHSDKIVKEAFDILSRLDFISISFIMQFVDEPKPLIREEATKALGKVDSTETISLLLEALADDRAQNSIYALRHILALAPKADALQLLSTLPMDKVAVAKEVVRLVADLNTSEAYQHLVYLESTSLHVDVRVALLKSLFNFFLEPQTWEILNRAATSQEKKITSVLTLIPLRDLPPSTVAHVAMLFTKLVTRPELHIQNDALMRLRQDIPHDPTLALPRALINLLRSTNVPVCNNASIIIFPNIVRLYPELSQSIAEAMSQASSYRHLQAIAQGMYSGVSTQRKECRNNTLAVLAALEHKPHSMYMRARIIVQCLPWPDNLNELRKIAPKLHADAISYIAVPLIEINLYPDGNLEGVERALASSGLKDTAYEKALPKQIEQPRAEVVASRSDDPPQPDTNHDGWEKLSKDDLQTPKEEKPLSTIEQDSTATPTPRTTKEELPQAIPVDSSPPLNHRANERLRRLGVSALEGLAVNGGRGWTPELKARLDVYRNDKSEWVAEVASWAGLPGEGYKAAEDFDSHN